MQLILTEVDIQQDEHHYKYKLEYNIKYDLSYYNSTTRYFEDFDGMKDYLNYILLQIKLEEKSCG